MSNGDTDDDDDSRLQASGEGIVAETAATASGRCLNSTPTLEADSSN